ncbi:MAG: radical SAM protein [Candidatus Altiarchaeota archaeon]
MIKLLSKIPSYWSTYYLGWPNVLPVNYTISLTFRCNSRCLTCDITGREAGNELTLEELGGIFSTIGKPYWVTLSGGEPFLREELEDICTSLYRRCMPSIVNIPTNGLAGSIPDTVKAITEAAPNTSWIVNLSLDGIGEKHDRIRGVRGNFERAVETYRGLRKLRNRNLSVGIHTVISRHNVSDIPHIYDYVMSELKPDSYITEIAEERVELDNVGSGVTPSQEDYSKAIGYITSRTRMKDYGGTSRITQAFRLEYYENVKRMLSDKRQIIPCYAGIASAQISADGDVWFCCIKADPVGNLRECDYDFKKLWFSERAESMRKTVRESRCYCPLANAAYTNMLVNPKTLLRVLWRLL